LEAVRIREILAEAKAIQDTSINKDGTNPNLIIRYWDEISREDLDALVDYLEDYTSAVNAAAATTVVDPMKGTQWARAGTWNGGAIYPKMVDREGGRGKVLRLYQELFAGEKSVGTVTVENGCRYIVEIYETFFGKTTLPTVPASTAGVSYKIEAFRVHEKFGTYSGYIEKRTRVVQDVAEYSSALSAAATGKTTEKLGTTDSALLPITQEAGKINRRAITKNEDCSFDLKKEEITVIDQTATAGDDSAAANAVKVLNTEAAAAPSAPSAAAGTLIRQTSAPTEAGKYRNMIETVTVKDQTATSAEDSAAKSATRAFHSENAAALGVPTATAGTIKRNENRPTEAGRTQTTEEVITVKDQTATSKEESGARSVARVLNTENASTPADPAATPGEINRVELQPTEAGRLRSVVEKVTVKDQTATSAEDSAAKSATRAFHSENATPLGAPTATAGTIKRNENRPTEAGLTQTTEEVVTVKDQTATAGDDSAAANAVKVLNTEAAAAPSAPSAAAGTIIRQSSQPTEAGKFRNMVETVTVKDQTATSAEDSAAKSATRAFHSENAAALGAPTATAGTIKRNENRPTEAGRTQTVEEVVTVKDQTATSAEDSAAKSATRAFHSENAAALGAPTATAGTIKRNENRPTEAGLTQTTEEVVTVKDQTATSAEDSAAKSVSRAFHTENATALGTPTATAGTIKRNENRPTEAGRTQTVEEVVTVKDQTATAGDDSAAASALKVTNTEAAAQTGAQSAAAGTIVRSSSAPTEAGKYRNIVETVTVKDQTADSFEKSALETIAEALHTEGSVIADEALATGTVIEVANKPTEAGKYATVRRVRTGVYVLTSVSYTDRYGNSYYARGVNGTQAQFEAAVTAASLTNASNNSVSKEPSQYKDLFNFTIIKQAYDSANMTTFYGTLGTFNATLLDIEKWTDAIKFPVNRYGTREVTITVVDYWGISLTTAWSTINNGDADSKPPEFKGLVGGIAVYHSRKLSRSYGAWGDGG